MSFMGELSDISVADLLYLLALRRQTGKLSISVSGEEATLYLDRGQLILVKSSTMSLRLGRMLQRLGFLDGEQLREALRDQESAGPGRPLGSILIDRGWVTDEELRRCVEEQCIEILARVIATDRGIFAYHRGAVIPPRTEVVPLNPDRIVLEATRRTDELVALRGLLPSASAPLMISPCIDAVADTLTDAEVFVAAALQSGAASLSELTSQLGIEDMSLWRTVISMRERGLIVAGRTEDGTDPPLPALTQPTNGLLAARGAVHPAGDAFPTG